MQTAKDLLEDVLSLARAERAAGVLLGHTPSSGIAVLEAARALGFRLISTPAYQIEIEPGSTFEDYLARLSSMQRKGLKRDLRRLVEAGATMEECGPTPALLRSATQMHQALLERKGVPFQYRQNPFEEMARYIPAECIDFARCVRSDETIGVCVGLRTGTWAGFGYWLHVDDPTVNLYAGIGAWWLRREIARGSQTLYLSFTNDQYKRRLGSVVVPTFYGYRRAE
jgi:predicted N-acyltransferase